MNEDEILRIRAQVDRTSFQTAESTLRRFDTGVLKGFGERAIANIERLRDRVESVDRSLASLYARADRVEAARRTPSMTTEQRLETADRAGTLGSQIFGALGQSDLANASGLIADVATSIQGAGLAAGATVLGMAALTAAITIYNAQNDKLAQSTRALISTQEEYYRLLLTGSREDVEAALENAQTERDIIRARLEENRRILSSFSDQAGGVNAALADVFNIAGVRELREETQQLEQQLGSTEFEIGRLTHALETNAIAAEDSTAALAELNQQYTDLLLENARSIEQLALRRAQFEEMTREQAEDRIDQLNTEQAALEESIAYLESFAEGNEQVQEELERTRQRLEELRYEEEELRYVIDTVISSREQEIDIANRSAESFKRAADRRRQQDEEEAQSLARQKQANADRARQRRESDDRIANSEKRIAELRADLAERSRDLIDQYNEDERRSARDHQKELERISRDAGREQLDAIGNRDALAFAQSKKAQKDSLDDAKEAERDRADDQRRNLERSLQQNRASAERAISIEREKILAELQLRRSSSQAVLSLQQREAANRVQTELRASELITRIQQAYLARLAQSIPPPGKSQPTKPTINVNVNGGSTKEIVNKVAAQLAAALG